MYLFKPRSVVVAAPPQKILPTSFDGFVRVFLVCVLGAFSFNAFAACQYVVTNQGSSWFGGAIRITNTGTTPISGWSVSWKYTGNNVISSSWNTNLTGSNPYTATHVSWNSTIAVGQTIEFGVQGSKSGPAEVPVVSGSVCGDLVASSSSVISQSSSKNSSSVASSTLSSSLASSAKSAIKSSTKSSIKSSVKSSTKSSASNSSKSSAVSSSIRSSFSSAASSAQSSPSTNGCVPGMVAEGFVTGNVCNWYGTYYPLCNSTRTGWSYENDASCIGAYSCNLAKPYGLYLCPVSSSSSKSSIKSSSSLSSSSSSSAAAFSGIATHFDGLGIPFGGCGIPEGRLETQSYVALNVFNTPGNYNFYARPLSGDNLKYMGEFSNGKNCGRWIRVSVQEFCDGTNDGAQEQAFCRNGLGWVKDGYEGATQDVLVAGSCADDNAWCRDSPYHLDFSLASMNLFTLNGTAINLLPDHDNNRKISWHYIEAPNYSGDINIYFIAGAEYGWPAISINHLQNGIHGVEQLINGVWTAMPMNKDVGQSYVLQPGSTTYQIRVRDAKDQLINGGRVYSFGYPLNCIDRCTEAATQVSYTIQ